MKLVSTSNFELERAEGPQRSKMPSLDVKDGGKASEFSRSMLKLTQVSFCDHVQEPDSKQESESNPDAENLMPNVEALAAAPLNDKSLTEGFALFGSVFSLLHLKQSSEVAGEGKTTSVLDFHERSASLKLSRDGAVASIVESGGLDSVVIGFDKANNKASALLDLKNGQIDHPLSVAAQLENNPRSESDFLTKLRLADQPDPSGAAVIQLRPKDDDHQPAVGALTSDQPGNYGSLSTTLVSDAQPPSLSAPRVDQIVRAVLQQSAELSASHHLVAERQSHSGLTGQTLRLSLHPAELGGVQITVSKRGNRLQVTIVPDLESTGRLLLMDADQLAKSLGLASNNTDHVQIEFATPDGSVEMQSGRDLKQTFARSENSWNGQNGQHTSPQTSKPGQQESQNSDEARNVGRKRISDHRTDGAVYI